MYILDTNVISAAMRGRQNPNVVEWLGSIPVDQLYTTTITEGEILYGIALMENFEEKMNVARKMEIFFNDVLGERILPYDRNAAVFYAKTGALRKKSHGEFSHSDLQIASISLCKNFTVVTRNVKDFEGTGVKLFNRFE